MRYNPHKRTLENHRVCSRQLLVRVINDFLIQSVSRFSTKISSMRYNPHKRTFENHRVCSRQLLVRLVNDFLIRSVLRFSTKICSMRYNPHKRTFENHQSHSFIGKKISFKPTLRRRNEIIAALKECQICKQMRPASAFLGRPNFLLSTSYTTGGRAATQPLVDRASNRHEGKGPGRANKPRCTHSMTHMLNFFEQLFAHLPPLVFDFRSQQRPKVVIYTVASFSEHRNGMGFSTFQPRNQKSIRLRCSLS